MREWKNRAKKIRGVKKTKASDAAKGGKVNVLRVVGLF